MALAVATHSALPAPRVAGVTARLIPGLGACAVVAAVAIALQAIEHRVSGRVWVEALVLAILIGAILRFVWTPQARWRSGIEFSARVLLEVAVLLLGASVSAATLTSMGPGLLIGIAAVVTTAIGVSYAIGRALGLPARMATLVACGNAICGNSAIAAVAPVIGADGEEVASAIAFTAVLGVAAVLCLPLVGAALHMGVLRYGAFTGLTVYAVPQVLAAAAPMGSLAVQMGTLVKLVRVLMLGPVCCIASLIVARRGPPAATGARDGLPALGQLIPWFILGFLALTALRSFGLIPAPLLSLAASAASLLTVVSMAALGLMTDVKVVARAGGRVTAAVGLSLLGLGLLAYATVRLLGVG